MPVSVVELASHRRTQRLLHELAAHDEGSAVAPEELHVEAEGRRLASVELPLSAPLSVALPRRARSLTVVDDEGLVRASILRAELGAPHELEIAPGLTLSIGQTDHGGQIFAAVSLFL